MRKCFTVNCMRREEDFKGYKKLIKDGLYQAIEIFYPYNVDENQCKLYTKEVEDLVNELDVEVVLHLPFGYGNSLCHDPDNVVLKRLMDAMLYANSFKAKKLTLHLGEAFKEEDRNKLIKEVIEVLKKLCDYAKKYDMQVMIENMPGFNELGYSPEEILYIIRETKKDNLKFILDTGHAHVSEYEIEEYIYKLKDYLYHIHFSDNMGKRDEHKRIHLGNIDFDKVFSALKKVNYKNLHCSEIIFHEYTELILFAHDLDEYDKYYL